MEFFKIKNNKVIFILLFNFLLNSSFVMSIKLPVGLDDPTLFPDTSFSGQDNFGSTDFSDARISKSGFHCRNHYSCFSLIDLGKN